MDCLCLLRGQDNDLSLVNGVGVHKTVGVAPDDLIYYGLEYKYLTKYVIGELSYDEMFEQLEIAIHQFAKRQMTWFRGMERRGYPLHWLDWRLSNEEFVAEVMAL